MLIRRNTKAFKTILEIIAACQHRADREKLIRLYITKAGHSIHDRINVEGIQGEAGLFYDMNYQAVLESLKSTGLQLNQSDEIPGIYFFHSSAIKAWDQTPFEFDEAIRKEFASLPELPVVRKKGKAEKFVFPAPKKKAASPPVQKEKVETKKVPSFAKASGTSKSRDKAPKIPEKGPKQPGYKLKHALEFTDLEKVIFRQPHLTKKDVLDYYNKMAEHILPYLKDRPHVIQLRSDHGKPVEYSTSEAFVEEVVGEELPEWIQTVPVTEKKERRHLLLCNDREHLLFYTETGCLQFNPCHSRTRSLDSPDYIVIAIDPVETTFADLIAVALAAKEILTGLQLPSFIKTDGIAGLHLYIPLDSKSKFETSKNVGEYICKLIRLKMPELITLDESGSYRYGKVSLDYRANEGGKSVVAPYSIVRGQTPTVAAPLLWEEVNEELSVDDFNYTTIFKRLKEVGDPFANLFKKKVSAEALLERIETNYSFLF
jgi:DNA ligase D-like protein (predicted polymerase)